jgi:hypothetical protein
MRDFGHGFLSQVISTDKVNTQVNFYKTGTTTAQMTDWNNANSYTNLLRVQTSFTPGAWHFYTVVYDMTGTEPTVTAYLDGVKDQTVTGTGLLCNISYQAKAVHVALGNGTKTTSTNYTYYEGANVDVDNVCMWKDVALTDEQVAALYANQQKSETVVIGSTGYGTLCPSDGVTVPDGIKAYAVSSFDKVNKKASLTEMPSYIAASTGALLQGTAAKTYYFPYGSGTAYAGTNMLKGVTASTAISTIEGAYTNFVLGNDNGTAVFGKVSADGTLAASKAYLQIPTADLTGAGAKCFDNIFIDNETTDIRNLNTTNGMVDVYSISGVKVKSAVSLAQSTENLVKGIYIINGKKIIIK